MFTLNHRKVLVTGATGGLGEAIARAFHAQGAVVAISGRRTDKLEELKASLGHDRVHVLAADLAEIETLAPLVDRAVEAMDGLDVLVNNAGITKDGLMLRMKEADYDAVLEVNLKAPFMLMQSALKPMMKNKFGRIINISSVVGVTGNPGQTNYCAAKAGLIGMSKSLALEMASRGITVNCIAPGYIASAMTDAMTEEQRAALVVGIPQKKPGRPEDIAAAAVYLASDEASYVTGQTLHVNGGLALI